MLLAQEDKVASSNEFPKLNWLYVKIDTFTTKFIDINQPKTLSESHICALIYNDFKPSLVLFCTYSFNKPFNFKAVIHQTITVVTFRYLVTTLLFSWVESLTDSTLIRLK
jgi:hypothetical protein